AAGRDQPGWAGELLAQRAVDEVAEGLVVEEACRPAVDDGAGRARAGNPAADAAIAGPEWPAERHRALEAPARPGGHRHLWHLGELHQAEESSRAQVRLHRALRAGQTADHHRLLPPIGRTGRDVDAADGLAPLPGPYPVGDLVGGEPGLGGLRPRDR